MYYVKPFDFNYYMHCNAKRFAIRKNYLLFYLLLYKIIKSKIIDNKIMPLFFSNKITQKLIEHN